MNVQIEAIRLPSLDKYLDTKYASTKQNLFVCDICNEFVGSNKQSLSAHKRGCKRKITIANTMVSNS